MKHLGTKRNKLKFAPAGYLVIFFALLNTNYFAQEKRFVTVASDGSADYITITAAIYSLPMFNYQRTQIFVKNGIYNEKIRIDQDFITLKGESREKTILKYSQLRTDWIANKDSIGPAVINLSGDDFILENMTVENAQPQIGPHAFAVYGTGTRTVILNCNVISKGGDTVSLWDYKTGMYYHANCYFEGAVDFVCPRGWCFIRDSKFYEVKKTASIWHAGGDNIDQKFVIRNSSFDGVAGFELGRHHYEAQFFLLDCQFSDSMSSKPIYRVVYEDSARNRPFNWGQRYFFYNCFKKGEKLDWIKDNLPLQLSAETITPQWTFGNKWDSESKEGPRIISFRIEEKTVLFFLNEKVTVMGNPILETEEGTKLYYIDGGGSDTMRFSTSVPISKKNLRRLKIFGGQISGLTAGIYTRIINLDHFPYQIR